MAKLRALTIVCLLGSVSAAVAQESRRGPYVGLELGASASSNLRAPLTGISEPTRCDSLLRGGAVVPDCPAATKRELYRSDLDLGAGFGAGVVAGYDWGRARIEAEYSRQYSGSSTSPIGAADDAVTVAKAREWSELSPPFARVSDVLTQQAFVNGYVDALNGSRWTPYVGVGGGLVRTSLGYGNRYLRKTLAQGYYPDGGVDPLTSAGIPEWQRNAGRHGQFRGDENRRDALRLAGTGRGGLRDERARLGHLQGSLVAVRFYRLRVPVGSGQEPRACAR